MVMGRSISAKIPTRYALTTALGGQYPVINLYLLSVKENRQIWPVFRERYYMNVKLTTSALRLLRCIEFYFKG